MFDTVTVLQCVLESPILRQFCNVCSRDRFCDSFAICARESDSATVLQCLLERPILRQFCNMCLRDQFCDSFAMCARESDTVTVFRSKLRYYEYATVFTSSMRACDSFYCEHATVFRPCPPSLGPTFLLHMMTFPATLDNPTPQNMNTLGKYND